MFNDRQSLPPRPAATPLGPIAPLTKRADRKPVRGERGFNLIELLMSMTMASIMFMATVTMFVHQGDVLQSQNQLIDTNREARFVIEHLRRDLASLGSNATPNSLVDPMVCLKPDVPLRAITVSIEDGYVNDPILNPNVRPAAMTLFGSLDIKQRFKTASMDADKVFLFDDGTLPATQDVMDQYFSTDRYLRITGVDGKMMYLSIVSSSAGDHSVTVSAPIPKMGPGQACGYQGFGQNYKIDVQNFVRYRIIADSRPGAVTSKNGAVERGLLVRENLGLDGATLKKQTILAENAVDLAMYDLFFDSDPSPDVLQPLLVPLLDDVVQKNGGGVLGTNNGAKPESLRFLTVKVSLRSEWADKNLVHQQRQFLYGPLMTWKVADDGRGAYPVSTVATRVTMPTMTSRNL